MLLFLPLKFLFCVQANKEHETIELSPAHKENDTGAMNEQKLVERTTSAVTQPTTEVLDKAETGVVETVKDAGHESRVGNVTQVPSPEAPVIMNQPFHEITDAPEEQQLIAKTSLEHTGNYLGVTNASPTVAIYYDYMILKDGDLLLTIVSLCVHII